MNFIARRLGITLITLFLASFFTFAAFRLIPGDAALLAAGIDADEEQTALLRSELGLDRGFLRQYLSWLGNFLRGRLGNSSRFRGEQVSAMIGERIPVTMSLAGLSLLFIFLISLPLSLFSAKNEGGVPDRCMTVFTALNISFPGFFLGVLFIWIFGLLFRFFVPGSYVDYAENGGAFLAYLVFPALAVALPNSALLVKFLRSSIFRELKNDYIRTALSKGNPRSRVLYAHALKNAVIPAVTLLGMITGEVFSGSIVIEQVFAIPGLGRLLIASIGSRDYPMVQTLVVYMAFAAILANTLVDIAIQIIDPRIRVG
jgi:ABC-type dipeptide/oligopeptide/nickel transport system permease component